MAKKVFTDESLSAFAGEIKSYTDNAVSTKANLSHGHNDVTNSASGFMSPSYKTKLDNVEERATYSIPIVQMTSADGVSYTATIEGVTELTPGMTFMFLPSVTTTTTSPTLNVNGLGAFTIRRKLSIGTGSGAQGVLTTFLYKNRPTILTYDNSVGSSKFWYALDFTKPAATDLYGTTGVPNGGTGLNTITSGSFLVGNGTGSMIEKTPAEVLDLINGANVRTMTTAEYNALEEVNANTLYALTDSEEEYTLKSDFDALQEVTQQKAQVQIITWEDSD